MYFIDSHLFFSCFYFKLISFSSVQNVLFQKGITVGKLNLVEAVVTQRYSFLDFVIGGGTQLNCTFAIDFTGKQYWPLIFYASLLTEF